MSGVSITTKNTTLLMGRKCFLCQNTRYRSKHCRLFRFPVRGTAMWNRWLTALALSEEDFRPNEQPRVCQRHFDPKHFLTRQLSGMAVPVRHLKRINHKQRCAGEGEYSSSVARCFDREAETPGVFGTECSDILDETKSDYEVAEEELSVEDEELLQDSCPSLLTNTAGEEQSTETETTATGFRCSIVQHEALEGLLSQERARVERLLRKNAQQEQIIEEQRNLLWQLGVECVALHPDKVADDSD